MFLFYIMEAAMRTSNRAGAGTYEVIIYSLITRMHWITSQVHAPARLLARAWVCN
jgi:hypothetical protein